MNALAIVQSPPADQPQVLFLSHGGGPLPLLGDVGHREMVSCLHRIAAKLRPPSAIVVVSAHWEEDVPTVASGAHPSLIYDYVGFPKAAYEITYPCPGEPALADRMVALLHGAGGPARLDSRRGFDHGLFVPLKLMFPSAEIPCVQLSLLNSLRPAEHLELGRQLRDLNQQNLLVIGSGFTFHNIREFFRSATPETQAMNEAFEAWLVDTCSSADLSETEREQRLLHWEQAPHARYCHPREEHLLPLHVCYGLTKERCSEHYELHILNRKTSMFLWL